MRSLGIGIGFTSIRGAEAAATPPTYVGGTTAQIAPSDASNTNVLLTSLTGGSDAAPSENDIVIIAYATGTNVDRDLTIATAGYTEAAEVFGSDANEDVNLAVFYKVMGASPDTSVDIGPTLSTFDPGVVAIHVWRGVDTVTPMDVAPTTFTQADTNKPNPPAITPVTPGAIVISAGGAGSDGALAVYTSVDLSNFIQQDRGGGTSAVVVRVAMGSIEWSGGEVDPAQWGGGSTRVDNAAAAITLALRPA